MTAEHFRRFHEHNHVSASVQIGGKDSRSRACVRPLPDQNILHPSSVMTAMYSQRAPPQPGK